MAQAVQTLDLVLQLQDGGDSRRSVASQPDTGDGRCGGNGVGW